MRRKIMDKTNFNSSLEKYIDKLQKCDKKGTEYTPRTYFQIFIENMVKGTNLEIIQEPKKDKFGRPDFKVIKGASTIGYIETKKLNEDLSKYKSSEQILRYTKVIDNLILTNYQDFYLYIKGKLVYKSNIYGNIQINVFENQNEYIEIEKIHKIFTIFSIFYFWKT